MSHHIRVVGRASEIPTAAVQSMPCSCDKKWSLILSSIGSSLSSTIKQDLDYPKSSRGSRAFSRYLLEEMNQ